jgi:hypothetical protein
MACVTEMAYPMTFSWDLFVFYPKTSILASGRTGVGEPEHHHALRFQIFQRLFTLSYRALHRFRCKSP